MTDQRSAELADRLEAVRQRIAAACDDLRRPTPTLIVVTKYFGADDVRRLAALQVTDVGENRDQEAREKHRECAGLGLTWHFIGQLQTNKAKLVVSYADLIHTVDRESLVGALQKASAALQKSQDVLLQVNLDPAGATGRGGVDPGGVTFLAEMVAASPNLRLRGVMAVAPLGVDPAGPFERLQGIAEHVRSEHPAADIVSAGMSTDLEVALAHGATHLRIGTAVMGSRPGVR